MSIPNTVTIGSGRLVRILPVVEDRPEGVKVTGSISQAGHTFSLGTGTDGQPVAWVVETDEDE